MKKEYKKEQYYSDRGKSFPELHDHIVNIQGWLRGIHHQGTGEYLVEFHYKFNRRNSVGSKFNSIITSLILALPLTLNAIKKI